MAKENKFSLKKLGNYANRGFNPFRSGSSLLGRLGALSNDATAIIMGAGLFKDGGRVRGVGKATHGYGKAMKKQGKK
jgi:hypothetical protein|tara:strand:- start:154 stop:384 length:231 start_codon:yes stop_codon:yes gene_type:complete